MHIVTHIEPQTLVWALGQDFIIAVALLPLRLRWQLIRDWNVAHPVICMLIITCAHGPFLRYVQTLLLRMHSDMYTNVLGQDDAFWWTWWEKSGSSYKRVEMWQAANFALHSGIRQIHFMASMCLYRTDTLGYNCKCDLWANLLLALHNLL